MKNSKILATAALLIATGIIAGAFGAHALKDILSEYQKGVYEKAVFYQITQALGVLILGFNSSSRNIIFSAYLIIAGIIIFSGSLYILTFSGIKIFGAITPIGGSSLIAGWLYLAWSFLKGKV